jgi:hypothetical protein
MCPDCKAVLIPCVLFSAAGFYVGTQCNCGPYERLSGYFKSPELAAKALTVFQREAENE